MTENTREIVAIVFAAIAFLAASSMDYEDAVSDMDVYCEQVSNKVWPDFKPETNCEE